MTSAICAPGGVCDVSKAVPGPPTVKYIIVNELAERFTYYANKAILTLYMQVCSAAAPCDRSLPNTHT